MHFSRAAQTTAASQSASISSGETTRSKHQGRFSGFSVKFVGVDALHAAVARYRVQEIRVFVRPTNTPSGATIVDRRRAGQDGCAPGYDPARWPPSAFLQLTFLLIA
jgi:hypothetical protein